MRQRFTIIATIALVLAALVGLNAASYVRVERSADSEFTPDRSTYNSGATGTRALYDLLAESGRPVTRWREPPAALNDAGSRETVKTFVIIGEPRLPVEAGEANDLLRWVEHGGRLFIVDRRPTTRLLPPSGNWHFSTEITHYPSLNVRPDNIDEMTRGVQPVRPAQPTAIVRDVESVMPSRFAGIIKFTRDLDDERDRNSDENGGGGPVAPRGTNAGSSPELPSAGARKRSSGYEAPPPPIAEPPRGPAPVVHLSTESGALLIDYPHGWGRIILLSDPFIVANNGLSSADNVTLAVNALTGDGGLIAFDEYHQGRGVTRNQLLAYFEGTPVIAMLAQLGLVIAAVLWTKGRRFGRPLPVATVDRRSSLEYVASMAELAMRARAFDLAIEDVYSRIRRVLARYAGVGNNATRHVIAERVAARSGLDESHVEALMHSCEDAINGVPIDEREAVNLVVRLRSMERALGLVTRSRELKQAR